MSFDRVPVCRKQSNDDVAGTGNNVSTPPPGQILGNLEAIVLCCCGGTAKPLVVPMLLFTCLDVPHESCKTLNSPTDALLCARQRCSNHMS